MTKQVIINADDFGRHEAINEAVELGVMHGCLRSATIMQEGMPLPVPSILPGAIRNSVWESISRWSMMNRSCLLRKYQASLRLKDVFMTIIRFFSSII